MNNIWYVIAKLDESKYGCKQITQKGEHFKSIEEANIERIYLQPDYNERLVILKRTCEII